MSRYLRTLGKSNLAIGICDRCHMKVALADMKEDRDSPGLRVCSEKCNDKLDPYKLPARRTEDVTVRYPRPEEPLT